MLKPTPHPKTTSKNASCLPIYYLESPWKGSAQAFGVTSLGVISDAISYWPPLPSTRVGNGLHSILGWFKVGLEWLVSAYSCHYIHARYAKEVGPQSTKGVSSRHKVGWYPGCKGVCTQCARKSVLGMQGGWYPICKEVGTQGVWYPVCKEAGT